MIPNTNPLLNHKRGARGQRIYSTADVERLASLAAAVKGGWRIGRLARLPKEELEKIAAEAASFSALSPSASRAHAPASSPEGTPSFTAAREVAYRVGGVPSPPGTRTARVLDACMEAVENLDESTLKDALFRGSVELGETSLIDDVVVPLMRMIGEAWSDGSLRVLHEHAASAVMRTYLGDLLASAASSPLAPCAVAATLPGELHELGALAAAAAATIAGWRVRYLGSNTPAEEIVRAAELTGSRAVLVSIAFAYDERKTPEVIARIRRFLPEGCDLILGGEAAARNRVTLSVPGVRVVDDLRSLRPTLADIRRGGRRPAPGVRESGDGREPGK